ncbi:hypothetical protein PMAYCL1PPCAC_10268 [Pristionchus mayeri]|uniref:Uncharacterized protein n=1 Tax=Pristionchus mayeri TaxID=1317129 RepID=A0AAN4ZF40_9BILA|nr:hypothetical protein PMAYCL1PPCAC_10268 [Pristionchus mayeri]
MCITCHTYAKELLLSVPPMEGYYVRAALNTNLPLIDDEILLHLVANSRRIVDLPRAKSAVPYSLILSSLMTLIVSYCNLLLRKKR